MRNHLLESMGLFDRRREHSALTVMCSNYDKELYQQRIHEAAQSQSAKDYLSGRISLKDYLKAEKSIYQKPIE